MFPFIVLSYCFIDSLTTKFAFYIYPTFSRIFPSNIFYIKRPAELLTLRVCTVKPFLGLRRLRPLTDIATFLQRITALLGNLLTYFFRILNYSVL